MPPPRIEQQGLFAAGKSRTTLKFLATDYEHELAAAADLLDIISPIVSTPSGDQVLDDWSVSERLRIGHYVLQVNYADPKKQKNQENDLEAGEWQFSFDTSGAQAQITQSLETRAYDSTGRVASKDGMFKGAIDVGGRGRDLQVKGASIVVPKLSFQVRFRFPSGYITTDFAQLVSELTGQSNDANFPPSNMPFVTTQWEPEEVLFLGASGLGGSDNEVELTLHFDAGKEVADLQTGDIIGITRPPHDILWFRYKTDTDSSSTVSVPEVAFVERVYESNDLDQLFPIV